jgi:hypothetical protein
LLINLVFASMVTFVTRQNGIKTRVWTFKFYLMPIPILFKLHFRPFDGSVALTVNKSSSVSSQLKHNYGKAIRLIQSKSNHQLSVHIVSKKPRFNHQYTKHWVLEKSLKQHLWITGGRTLYRWYFRSQDDVQCWLDYVQKTHDK